MNWLKMVFIGVLKKSLLIIFIPGKSAFCLFTKRSHKIYLCEFTVVWGLLINIAESENWLCQFTENGCSSLIAVYVSSQETSQWTRMLIEQFIDQKCNGQEIWTLRYQTILWTERYMKFRLCSEEVFCCQYQRYVNEWYERVCKYCVKVVPLSQLTADMARLSWHSSPL